MDDSGLILGESNSVIYAFPYHEYDLVQFDGVKALMGYSRLPLGGALDEPMSHNSKWLGPRGLSYHSIFVLVHPLDVYSTLLIRMYGTKHVGFDWKLYYLLMQLSQAELQYIYYCPAVFSLDGVLYNLHY